MGTKAESNRKNQLDAYLKPEFGCGPADPDSLASMTAIWTLAVDGSRRSLVPESGQLVLEYACPERGKVKWTTARVKAECVRRMSETDEGREQRAKVANAVRGVTDAYQAAQRSEETYYRDGWTLARRLIELRDAQHTLIGRIPSVREISELLAASSPSVNITEQRVGQCLNTAGYYPADAVDEAVSLRVYDEARKFNEKRANNLTPGELAEVVKAHRQREDLTARIDAAIAEKYPAAKTEPAAQEPAPPSAPPNDPKPPQNESSFHTPPEPTASPDDAPDAEPTHELSIVVKVTGAGPIQFQVLYDGSPAVPSEAWAEGLLFHAWKMLERMRPSPTTAALPEVEESEAQAGAQYH